MPNRGTRTALPRAPRPVHLPALVSFECVARHLSFGRASDALDVTTTAISKTIKQLEAQLDVRLLIFRHSRSCRFTHGLPWISVGRPETADELPDAG
jgi:Bacterial regulatory helix-turn-helix protein, lysR family